MKENLKARKLSLQPDNYNLGQTKGKALIELRHAGLGERAGKKIDFLYVRSMREHADPDLPGPDERFKKIDPKRASRYVFHSEAEFCAKIDVDKKGRPLPKLLLFRARTNDFLLF